MALQNQTSWVMDSGASSHRSTTNGILLSHLPSSHSFITVGNGHTIPITCRGESILPTAASNFVLSNVLVVPSLVRNLLSARQFTRDNNCSIEFDALGFSVKDILTNRMMLCCNSAGDLYTLPATPPAPQAHLAISTDLWHHRLGHPGSSAIDVLRNNNFIHCNKAPNTICHSCQLGKHVCLPFSYSRSSTSRPFELIHCDVWTSPVASVAGAQYYLVLLDDFTHFCWTFPLVRKSEVATHIASFCNLAQNQFNLAVKTFQADNGKEFINTALATLFTSRSILLRLSCPYTSPQNGKAERVLRTLNNIIRTLLIHAHMPPPYWAEDLSMATYLLNRRPSSAIQNGIHFSLLYGSPPDYSLLRVFGCLYYPNMTATARHKLAPRSTACMFLGYPSSHKGYRCLDLSTRRIIISRHVVFDETCFPFSLYSPKSSPSDLDFLLAGSTVPV